LNILKAQAFNFPFFSGLTVIESESRRRERVKVGLSGFWIKLMME
jgi:hypothetical protein